MVTAGAIADRVQQAWAEHLLAQQRGPAPPHPYAYASQYRSCPRRMVLEMAGTPTAPPSADLLARFRRGDDRARDLLADLARIGRNADPPFRIEGQEKRFELKGRRGQKLIVGKVDAELVIDGLRAPLECKAWAPAIVDRIDTFEDLFAGKWTVSGAYQLLAYMFGAGVPVGFLLLDRSGLPKLLPVELDQHLERMEQFLQRAEAAVDHIEAGTLPDYIDDPAECVRCPFYGDACQPPLSHQQAVILQSPELEAALKRRDELQAAAKEFEAWDADLKKRLRGVETAICGEFQIIGRWSASSRVQLPDDLKKQYTVRDEHGRFTLEIVRYQP
jgi:hypothetical protein